MFASRVSLAMVNVAKTVVRSQAVRTYVHVASPVRMVVPARLTVRSFSEVASGEPFLDVKLVTERVIEVLRNFEKVDKSKVTAQSRFKEDLDLDSLDGVEVVMAIEEEFNIEIPESEADKILSVQDAVKFISTHPMAK